MDAAAIADRYDLAATLIADAGALALGYFRDQASLEIASKGLQDMASQADLETERLIRDRIAETWPDDAFFGEESGGIAPVPGQGLWVVDPIDGTANFVNAIPMWCVSIAFVVDQVIEFGLVCQRRSKKGPPWRCKEGPLGPDRNMSRLAHRR